MRALKYIAVVTASVALWEAAKPVFWRGMRELWRMEARVGKWGA